MRQAPLIPGEQEALEALCPSAWKSIPEAVRLAIWIAAVAVIFGVPATAVWLLTLLFGA